MKNFIICSLTLLLTMLISVPISATTPPDIENHSFQSQHAQAHPDISLDAMVQDLESTFQKTNFCQNFAHTAVTDPGGSPDPGGLTSYNILQSTFTSLQDSNSSITRTYLKPFEALADTSKRQRSSGHAKHNGKHKEELPGKALVPLEMPRSLPRPLKLPASKSTSYTVPSSWPPSWVTHTPEKIGKKAVLV